MNIHRRCPSCDERGTSAVGQDGEVLVCQNVSCRVFAFAEYLG